MPFSRSRSVESMTRSADVLVGPEGAGLAEHGVDQGGLAVVDVGHDGDVAEIGALHELLRGTGGRAGRERDRRRRPGYFRRTGSRSHGARSRRLSLRWSSMRLRISSRRACRSR